MRPVLSVICFLFFSAVLAVLFIQVESNRDIRRFENHSAIIADDIWALSDVSASSYLRLAMQRDYYKSLTVTEPNGDEYLSLKGAPLEGVDRVLFSLNLIGVKPMKTTIQYNNRSIGELSGEQYVRVIYPLVNSFIFLVAVVLAILLVGRLFQNRRELEELVRERTRNLVESERRFHDLVNLLPEMVWETDEKGMVSYANQMASFRLGLDEESNSVEWRSVIVTEQRESADTYFQDIMKGESIGLTEFAARDIRGRSFPVLLRSAPIYKKDQIAGARCVAIDITERYDLEEQLRRAQRMKAIGLMAGGVAHDLNNILSGIVTYPELLLLDLPENSPLRRGIESIRRSGQAAADVVSDLLTVARGVAATKEVTDINELVREYLETPEAHNLKSYHHEVEIVVDLDEDIEKISCSPTHIRKSLMNLVTNGAEAISGRGKVVISTGTLHLSTHEGAKYGLEQGVYTTLSVKDTGPGIGKEDMSHIFEPFYTKKMMGRSGTGLGLTVVWNTVQEHKGGVDVASDSNGTTFMLMFPLAEKGDVSLVAESLDWRTFSGNGEKIVVIDDEAHQREVACSALTVLNYAAKAVDSGEAAISYLQENSADLIILDMLMDPGLNGRQTYEEILKLHPQQKAIIVSGFSESSDVMETLTMGAGGFVHKPYSLAQLAQAVYREINEAEHV